MEGNTVVYLTPKCQVIFLFHKRLREIKKFIAFRDHYLNFLAQFPKCSVISFKQRSESEKRELIKLAIAITSKIVLRLSFLMAL